MSSAFRFQPATGRLDRVVQRPRLLNLLRDRFDHRLTLVVGPAGAGKSTALAQAVESNQIDPYGVDVWFGAEAADNDPLQLLTGLCQAVGVRMTSGFEPTLNVVAEEIWRQAPLDVALIVDDVHHIESESSLRLLTELLSLMPTNGHLVLAGRSLPAVPAARLLVHNQLLTVDMGDLEFDDDEVRELLDLRPVDGSSLDELPRHPALADLSLVAGTRAQVSFLEQEVLSWFDPERLGLLERVSVLAEFDEAIVRRLSGGAVGAAALVDGLPLVEETTDGGYRLHTLLTEALQPCVSAQEAKNVQRQAAAVETDRQNLPAAIAILASCGDIDAGVDLAREFATWSTLRRSYSELRDVHSFLQSECPDLALTSLFEHECVAALRARGSHPSEVVFGIAGVAEKARSEGDETVEALALFRAISGHDSDGNSVPEELVDRLAVLAETDGIAKTMLRQVRSAEAVKEGKIEEAVAWLDQWDGTNPRLEQVYRSVRLCDFGRPEEVEAFMTPEDLQNMSPGEEVMVAFAMWLRGEASPEVALRIVQDFVVQTLARGVVENSVSLLGVGVFIALTAGDKEFAAQLLGQGQDLITDGSTTRIRQFMEFGRAANAAVYQSDEAAGAILEDCLRELPLDAWPSRHHLLGLSLLYVTRPETRVVLEGCELGPSLATSVQAGRALISLRQSGSTEEAVDLPWCDADLLRVQVLPHHLCELAIGAMAGGNVDARRVLKQLPDLPHLLSRVTTSASEVVRVAAERQLRRFPVEPRSHIQILALGSITLLRDGERVEDPDWVRRRRVRELLAYLVERRSARRSEIARALWPDLDSNKGAGNLRVNLSYLQKVLEPNRESGVPPFYVQVEGERVFLHPSTSVDVDAFEKEMAEALRHDRAGAATVAYDLYVSCLSRYRGPFLADFDAAWCEDNQVRIDSLALGGHCRLGELTAAKGEPEEALQWAMRATRISELSERAGRLFVNCLLAMGDRAAAQQSLLGLLSRLKSAELVPESETAHLLAKLRE